MTPESKARAFDYVVREVAPVAEGVHRRVMGVPAELAGALAPGMFVNVEVPHNPAHLTRVPLSFASADAAAGELELVFAAVGDATRRLAALRPGEGATVLGPLGNGWWLPEGAGAGSRVVVVAGGVGLPPVVAAARMARSAGCAVDAVVGAQSASRLWRGGVDELERLGCSVTVTTDDGTCGLRGFTTDALLGRMGEHAYAACLTCGPNVMMAGVARIAREGGTFCEASLERMMTCGFGACSTCNVALARGGYASCCMDGPVFDAEEVAW